MEKIMVDTSAIYALLDRSDNLHQKAVSILQKHQLLPNPNQMFAAPKLLSFFQPPSRFLRSI